MGRQTLGKTVISNGSRRYTPWRFGYTLVETLAVLLIIGILASALTVFYKWQPPAKATKKEAEKLARWLTNLETISNRTGQSFKLICPGTVTRDYIETIWQRTSKKDTYTSAYGCKFNRYGGNNVDSNYSPQWSAMTPAITIKVSQKRAEHYVIISEPGRVRTSTRPGE